ncbi:MAG: 23S rRNA (guanosine(2251)-2'-O)-methyltransferase RlmB [Betaproteobacteria bacterium]|nr:23S rRNA (guanosine-2'-O-)-methyltransferase RlmB [Rhodocyclaceae bacterium]
MAERRLIAGIHPIRVRLRQRAGAVKELFCARERDDARMHELIQLAEQHSIPVRFIDAQRLDAMAGGARHQGVVARVDPLDAPDDVHDILDRLEDRATSALLLVLDGIQDPHNLGACLRVADAAGVHAVIAPKDRAVGISVTVERVAAGAVDNVPYLTVTNLARTLRELKERSIVCIGADDSAPTDLWQVDQQASIAWVLGAEGAGLRRLTRETCDRLARIPMYGAVESLNVSVATGICLFEARRQRERDRGWQVSRGAD